TMTATPIRKSTPCRMCVPVSSSPNRIASAQPPANAAPNTSAPIRMAAEITVTTLVQTIWRVAGGGGWELIGLDPVEARNLSEKCRSIKHKWPKKAASRDIAARHFQGPEQRIICDVRPTASAGKSPYPGLADALRDTALRPDQAGTFSARLRAGL